MRTTSGPTLRASDPGDSGLSYRISSQVREPCIETHCSLRATGPPDVILSTWNTLYNYSPLKTQTHARSLTKAFLGLSFEKRCPIEIKGEPQM